MTWALRPFTGDGIDQPGLWRMSAATYHADPCPTPSLSSSIANILIDQSPWHAWSCHPRLNPSVTRDDSSRLDLGTVAHALLIGEGRAITEIPALDFRTKAAQEARDAARLAGRTPVLSKDLVRAQAMVDVARIQLQDIADCDQLFDPAEGDGEVVCTWRQGGIWCRAMFDWLPRTVWGWADYKTTAGSAHPSGLGKTMANLGYELQAAFYEAALLSLAPELAGRLRPLFVFQEIDPPFAVSVVTPDEEAMSIGRKKVSQAIKTWAQCLEESRWPGYPPRVELVTIPTWALGQWMDREAREYLAAHNGRPDPFAVLRPGFPGGGRD